MPAFFISGERFTEIFFDIVVLESTPLMKISGIESYIAPVISDAGYELVDIEFRHGKGSSVLQVFIDREGGINFENLTLLSSLIGDVLESKNLIGESYSLEVSSPGIERPLKKMTDYVRFKGRRVKLSLYKPVNGSKSMLLNIKDVSGDKIILNDDSEIEVSLGLGEIAKANLYFDFNNK